METFHVIGEKEYSARIFETLDKLVLDEQMHIIKNEIRHSGKQITILMHAANLNESERFRRFGEYDHFSFLNESAKELLDKNGIIYNKVGECAAEEATSASLMIRNYLYV